MHRRCMLVHYHLRYFVPYVVVMQGQHLLRVAEVRCDVSEYSC